MSEEVSREIAEQPEYGGASINDVDEPGEDDRIMGE